MLLLMKHKFSIPIINLGCTGSVSAKRKINYSFGINNLLNVKYIDHLSRLKNYEYQIQEETFMLNYH
jgi:hypothetical protein